VRACLPRAPTPISARSTTRLYALCSRSSIHPSLAPTRSLALQSSHLHLLIDGGLARSKAIEAIQLPAKPFLDGKLLADCRATITELPIGGILVLSFIGLLIMLTVAAGLVELGMYYRLSYFVRPSNRISLEYQSLLVAGRKGSYREPILATGNSINDAPGDAKEEEEPEISRDDQPFFVRLLLCWAPWHNFQRLTAIPSGHEALRPLNAMRVFSILMVIFGTPCTNQSAKSESDSETALSFLLSRSLAPSLRV